MTLINGMADTQTIAGVLGKVAAPQTRLVTQTIIGHGKQIASDQARQASGKTAAGHEQTWNGGTNNKGCVVNDGISE